MILSLVTSVEVRKIEAVDENVLKPRIETLTEKKIIGKRMIMSLADNKTFILWQSFMSRRREITNKLTTEMISMQVYDQPLDFSNPNQEFEKWAAIEVADFDMIPDGMETFVLTGGLYAVFLYKGSSTDTKIFQYIFGNWLPGSNYSLDNRPYFEILGKKYRNNDPNSEEEIWIPIKLKNKEPNLMTIGTTFDHTTGHFISCGDAKIYVEEKGNPELPVLLMLHGGFGSVEDFNAIAPTLGSQFRLIGVDSRGHGKSSLGIAKLSYKLLEDDLAEVIDSLGLSEFSILGFSDGGIAAYRYAARQDPRLRKIVTVGSSWEMSENEPVWEMISGMTGEIWKATFPSSYDSYMHLNPMPDFDRFAATVVAMWTDLSPDGHPGSLMSKITNEILMVRGDNDPLTSLNSMAKLRSSAKNTSFLNIPFAGHVAFDDAPEVFLRTVGKFFGVAPL